MGIGFNRNISPLLLLFTISEYMCLTNSSDESNTLLNAMELVVSEFIMFHENKVMFPSGDSFDISRDNNDPTERITLVLFGIPIINQLGWAEVAKED